MQPQQHPQNVQPQQLPQAAQALQAMLAANVPPPPQVLQIPEPPLILQDNYGVHLAHHPHGPHNPRHAARHGAFRNGEENGTSHENGSSHGGHSLLPKHIPLPGIPREGDVCFELVMFLFTGISCCMQFLNIYRSIWWLPNSFNNVSVNAHMVDVNLLIFITTILARRLVYALIAGIGQAWFSPRVWPVARRLLRLMMLFWVSCILIVCTYNIMQTHPIVNIFYLCYPISVYFILFGLTIGPFFDITALPLSMEDHKDNNTLSFDGSPLHNCSTSPEAIREEVDMLKGDVNNRMKQVLFSSVFSAYYAGFIPCCFAQVSVQTVLYYDAYWATQHMAWIWLSCFVMYTIHCYPVRYCDVMHRAAIHLGRWTRVMAHQPYLPWSESILWSQDAVVKHCKDVYKAECETNAAEPSNQAHARFYNLFKNPTRLYSAVLTLELSAVSIQFCLLASAREWYQSISMSMMLFSNYYALYKIGRDFLVCHRVYKAERLARERSSS